MAKFGLSANIKGPYRPFWGPSGPWTPLRGVPGLRPAPSAASRPPHPPAPRGGAGAALQRACYYEFFFEIFCAASGMGETQLHADHVLGTPDRE